MFKIAEELSNTNAISHFLQRLCVCTVQSTKHFSDCLVVLCVCVFFKMCVQNFLRQMRASNINAKKERDHLSADSAKGELLTLQKSSSRHPGIRISANQLLDGMACSDSVNNV